MWSSRRRPKRHQLVTTLRGAGCVFAEDEADLLIAAATTPEQLTAMVARRASGHPLEQVVGWADFCGLRIVVEPKVFVPRHRTELLVREAAALCRPGSVVVDLCCGSGAVAAVLLSRVAGTTVTAADVHPSAVRCARVNLGARAEVYEGDLFAALPYSLRSTVDVLVANTPYVPTAEIALLPREACVYEPAVALDGGADGLDVQRRVAAGAADWLAPGGHLLVETSHDQATRAADIMTGAGLTARVVHDDDLGATVVVGTSG